MLYILLANGCEEIEAAAPIDILRRAGADVRTVGIGGDVITGAHGVSVDCDLSEDEFNKAFRANTELLFLPGGGTGTANLAASETVKSAVKFTAENGGFVTAICAAPTVLAACGVLDGKTATCYPDEGLRAKLTAGGAVVGEGFVIQDGKVITGTSQGAAVEFGLKLAEVLKGKETADTVRAELVIPEKV